MIKCGSSGPLHRSVVHSSRLQSFKAPETVPLNWPPYKTSGITSVLLYSVNTVLHNVLHLHHNLRCQTCVQSHRSLCYPRICAMGEWLASTIVSLNRKADFLLQLSGPMLYLRLRSLFDAILSPTKPLISGLPHPSAAREHPTYPFSGRLRLLCPRNDKAHV